MPQHDLTPRQKARLKKVLKQRQDNVIGTRIAIVFGLACVFALLFGGLTVVAIAERWEPVEIAFVAFAAGIWIAFSAALKDRRTSWQILEQIVDWDRARALAGDHEV